MWLFFEQAVPAVLARRLGSFLLTEAMERRPDIGLNSYDRLFPNQDTMPEGGFGNLIALPLQKGPRGHDNTVFLNSDLSPCADQWAFLATERKICRAQIEGIVQEAELRGRILGVRLPPQEDGEDEPWTAAPSRRRKAPPIVGKLPRTLEVVLGNQIYVPKNGLHPGLRNRLLRLAAFQNPEFYKAQAMRFSTYDKPSVVACAEDHHVGLPRGCLDDVRQTLTDVGIRMTIREERYAGRPLEAAFQGELRTQQQAAAAAMLAHDTGVLAATTAFGKTVIAAWLIAQRGVSTLVLVHRRPLLEQWIERLSAFLDLPPKSIGRIGGGKARPTGLLDVAVIQSLVRKGVVEDRLADYGHLIVDECHHLPARSFEQVVRQAKARFVVGLSATVARKDGHHPIVFMQCGPVRHRVTARAQAAIDPFDHIVLVQPTAFQPRRNPESDKRAEFQALYQELVADEQRNRRICDDVVEATNNGRSPLVLTERNDHLDRLENRLAGNVPHLVVLRARMGKRQRQGPIGFDGAGSLEVDLLCADVRVAVELDGAQHLADAVAYRGTGARIGCCRRTATSSCASLPKTLARSWTRCSTPSPAHSPAPIASDDEPAQLVGRGRTERDDEARSRAVERRRQARAIQERLNPVRISGRVCSRPSRRSPQARPSRLALVGREGTVNPAEVGLWRTREIRRQTVALRGNRSGCSIESTLKSTSMSGQYRWWA